MHDIINVNSLTKDYGGGRGIFDFDFSGFGDFLATVR